MDCRLAFAAAAVLAIVLSGCATSTTAPAGHQSPGGTSWHHDPCDASGATEVSGNAPVVTALAGGPRAVAKAVTRAVGDAWESDTPTDATPGEERWATRDGSVRVSTDSRGPGSVRLFLVDYTTSHGSFFNEAKVGTILAELGVDMATVTFAPYGQPPSPGHDGFMQTLSGQMVDGTEGSWLNGRGDPAAAGWYAGMGLPPLRNLSHTGASLDTSKAMATARAFSRCEMDRQGSNEAAGYQQQVPSPTQAEPGLAILYDSLAYVFGVTYSEPGASHCGKSQAVAVDAVTGAVLGIVPVGCD